MKKIPIGIDDFKKIRENNYYYIDKTNFIEEIGKNVGKTLLFTRPRRFGKTFFTITYEENGLLVFRKTVYDRVNDGYIYLYVSFPPEYKEYMSPIVEKMANTMKKR